MTSGRLMFDDAAQSTVLAIISVPQQMDVQETLQYFSEKESLIKMARILKTEFTRHYTIVLMFDSCAAADDFIYQYDDRQFNLLEEDRIIIKKVSSICTDHYIDPSLDVPASLKIKRKESEKYVVGHGLSSCSKIAHNRSFI